MIWPLLYAALWKLAPPLIGHYLRRRARKQPEYLQHWDERWARGEPRADDAHGAIWVHAVSVGETRAAAPLVAALRARWPDKPLLITQMTPTGRETALSLYPDACVRYLPYDAPDELTGTLDELERDLDSERMRSQLVVALDPSSTVDAGGTAHLCFDPHAMHVFDAETGANLTLADAPEA